MTDIVLTKDTVVQFLNRFEEVAEKEDFDLTDIQVLTIDATSASATCTYHWEDNMDGKSFHVQGRGTRVLVVANGRLQIIHEHLSRYPKQ